jgi:hypothetical protein
MIQPLIPFTSPWQTAKTNLPGQVALALSDFISSGALGAEDSVERQYEMP